MYLKSLELSGFKSFAKKGELSFTTPVTAIVGPNGSGKSNVAEAFRYALGEQSVKSLRGKKTEDLIWNGSAMAPRANRASVRLVFDNRKRLLDLDFDEVSIERIVHRDGASEYRLNDSSVRLRDVVEVLGKANIGASGHHIISQGEADRVLSANARERREMIEDALGLRVFQYKKTESQRKLEKTEENKKQVQALVKEHAPHLRFLERQMERLAKARDLKEQLIHSFQEYLKREELYLTYQEEILKGEREGPLHELSTAQQELASVRETLSKSAPDERKEELLGLEDRLGKLRTEKDELSRSLGRIEGQISFHESRRDSELSRFAGGAPVPRADVDTLLDAIEHTFDSIVQTSEIDTAKQAATQGKSEINDFKRGHADRSGEYQAEIEAKLQELAKERAKTDSDQQLVTDEISKAENAVTALSREMELKKDESHSAERRMFELMGKEQQIRGTLSSIDARLGTIKRDRDDFTRELAEAGALIGRAALGYPDFSLTKDGEAIALESLHDEDRSVQLARRRELEKLKIRLEELGGGASGEIEKEFKEASERSEFLGREVADLTASAESLSRLINDLDAELDRKFKEGIEDISKQFEEFFVLMFGGGSAGLQVVREKRKRGKLLSLLTGGGEEEADDAVDDEEGHEGVEIDVALPGKRVKGLMMLSGGERALTSIALIFAMSQVNPPPFIILDETDAALDEANSRRYGDLIEMLSAKSQLIVITHNRETMSRAGVLYGITMGAEGASKLLSVKFEEAVAVAK